MPKHSIYLSDQMHASLDLDPAGVEGTSARLSYLISVALEGMRDNVPTLPLNEWQCLLDVTNGHYRSHNDPLTFQLEGWVFSIAESGPECDEKWGLDCKALARKVNALPLIQRCAAYEVCRRFWVRDDINALHESYAAMLKAHGGRISQ